jgi:hypothetical protein
MNAARKTITFLFLFSSILAACAPGQSSESAIQTGIAQTLQIAQLETAAAGGGQVQPTTDPGAPANTAAPTEVPSATLSATPSIPTTTVTQNTNCRTGPSQFYSLVTTVTVGQVVEVLKTFSSSYVVIRNPNGSGDCWLFLQYASETDFGSFNLQQATQPPTPFPTATATPDFDWDGTWNVNFGGFFGVAYVNASGSGISATVILDVAGTDYTYELVGSLSSSHQVADGDWELVDPAGGDGSFEWQIKSGNHNQFVGNWGTGNEFCGWRSGSSAPSPCLED